MNIIKPTTHLLVFDLHGTVLKANHAQQTWLIFKHVPQLLPTIIKLLFAKGFLTTLLHTLRSTPVFEGLFEMVGAQYPLFYKLYPVSLAVAQHHTIPLALQEMLYTAHALGYTMAIFSNISPILLDDIKTRYPDIMKLFTYSITPQSPAWHNKNGTQLYQELCAVPALSHQHKIPVLFDNNITIIKPARACGIHVIHVRNTNQLVDIMRATLMLKPYQ
jgi:hypothetical protein